MSQPEPAAPLSGGQSAHEPPSCAASPTCRRPGAATHLFLYVDGASSGNPGPCGSAAILKTDDGTTILEKARAFGPGTNNEAEYQAVILGLELAAQLRPERLTIRSDSELLVRQLAGQYRVRAPNLKPLLARARRLLGPFQSVEIQFVPRSQNLEADRLARKAVEKARQMDATLPPEARKKPRQQTFKLK